MAVAEDDRGIADAVEHPLVVRPRLGRKALHVGERRSVDVQDAVQLLVLLERVQPALLRPEPRVAFAQSGEHVSKAPTWRCRRMVARAVLLRPSGTASW